ncbi:MAG: transposase [Gammaproteobacteria bacterium]|nr:transposase [Gammaproteobacteria bacterium]
MIKDRFKKSRKTYGYRRIHDDFVDLNELCDKHRIARIMNENNIRPKTKRKFKVTTDSKHNKPIR